MREHRRQELKYLLICCRWVALNPAFKRATSIYPDMGTQDENKQLTRACSRSSSLCGGILLCSLLQLNLLAWIPFDRVLPTNQKILGNKIKAKLINNFRKSFHPTKQFRRNFMRILEANLIYGTDRAGMKTWTIIKLFIERNKRQRVVRGWYTFFLVY